MVSGDQASRRATDIADMPRDRRSIAVRRRMMFWATCGVAWRARNSLTRFQGSVTRTQVACQSSNVDAGAACPVAARAVALEGRGSPPLSLRGDTVSGSSNHFLLFDAT